MVNCVSILGSTGSIGRQSLDIVKHLGIGVAALTAGKSDKSIPPTGIWYIAFILPIFRRKVKHVRPGLLYHFPNGTIFRKHPPAGHGRGFRRSTVSWPPLRGGCLPARADWGSVLPPEVTSWLLRVKAPLCRGSLFSVPSAPAAIFPLNNSCQAGGACRRPYIHRRYCLPPLIRHGLRHATFPQGKAILRRVGTLLRHPTVHPLNHGVAVTAPPTRREPFLCLNSAKTPEGVLRCWCIF